MNLQCIIVDDERHAMELVKGFIQATPGIAISGCFVDPLKALDFCGPDHIPDIAFLDVVCRA